jgi:hypothetical protein
MTRNFKMRFAIGSITGNFSSSDYHLKGVNKALGATHVMQSEIYDDTEPFRSCFSAQ